MLNRYHLKTRRNPLRRVFCVAKSPQINNLEGDPQINNIKMWGFYREFRVDTGDMCLVNCVVGERRIRGEAIAEAVVDCIRVRMPE